MRIKANFQKLIKPVIETWQKPDLSKKATIALGLAAVTLAPLGALGVYASEEILNDKSNLDLDSIKGKIFKNAALAYPVIWSALQAVTLGQAFLAASLTSAIDGILILLSSLYYDHLIYERVNTKLQIKRLQKDGIPESSLDDLKKHLQRTSDTLNFYTNAIFLCLLSWYGEFTALPDLSADVNPKEPRRVKPIESQEQILNLSNYWKRLKFNFKQEINATKAAFTRVFNPTKWKGTLLKKNIVVEKALREKGLKGPKAWFTRLGSSSLPSAFACLSALGRLTAGILFLSILPSLGLKAFSDREKSPEEKQQELQEHPIAQRAYNLADRIKSWVLWCSGLMSILMSASLAYRSFAGNTAAALQGGAGALAISAGAAKGPLGRLLTFLSSIGLTFANGLRNIVGAGK